MTLYDPLVNIEQAARRVGVSISTMTLWVQGGLVPGAFEEEECDEEGVTKKVWRIPFSALKKLKRPMRTGVRGRWRGHLR